MKIAIIGGSGKMGRWFARFLLQEGQEVVITGRSQAKLDEASQQLGVRTASNVEAARNADVILLSVPIGSFESVVKELAPGTHSGQMIIDITSVKAMPVEVMHRHIKTGLVLGTHPVFGPGASSIANQNFVLTPTNQAETTLAEKIKRRLEAWGARASLMTPQEHDETMAVVLGLAHFIAIVSADTLLSFDRLKQMEEVSGSTFKFLLTLVESVLSEDPELYASLQMNLPGLTKIEELFQARSKTWIDIVKKHDRQEFVSRMNALKDKLEKSHPDFRKAYERMYRVIEGD